MEKICVGHPRIYFETKKKVIPEEITGAGSVGVLEDFLDKTLEKFL